MKKIVYILANPGLYGSELHVLGLIDYLCSKYHIMIIVLNDGPLIERLNKKNVRIERIDTGYLFRKKTIKKILDVIKEFKPDIIHAHQPKALLLSSIIRIISKKRLIITVHSQAIDHALLHKGLKRTIVYLFHTFINIFSQTIADTSIFVSHSMYKKAVYKGKSVKISNWLRLEGVEQNSTKDAHNKIKLLSIGSITKAKGFDLLVQYVELLKSKNIDFEMTVLGGLDDKFMNQLNVSQETMEKIQIIGYEEQIDKYLANYDVFVLFSRSETFGMSYLEAMAYGLPIIAGDLPVLEEIVPKCNSLTFNLEDQLEYLLRLKTDRAFYKEVSQQNKERAFQNYSKDKIMNQMIDLYEGTVSL